MQSIGTYKNRKSTNSHLHFFWKNFIDSCLHKRDGKVATLCYFIFVNNGLRFTMCTHDWSTNTRTYIYAHVLPHACTRTRTHMDSHTRTYSQVQIPTRAHTHIQVQVRAHIPKQRVLIEAPWIIKILHFHEELSPYSHVPTNLISIADSV